MVQCGAIIMDSSHVMCIAPHCTTHVVPPLHTNRCIPKGQTHPPLLLSPSDGVVGSRLHLTGVPTVLTDDEIFRS